MKRFLGYFFMIALLIIHSCVKKSPQSGWKSGDLHPLEIKVAIEDPRVLSPEELTATEGVLIRSYLDTLNPNTYFPYGSDRETLISELHEFYRSVDYKPVWTTIQKPSSRVAELVSRLKKAYECALDPEIYRIELIRSLIEDVYSQGASTNLLRMLELDILLTCEYMLYAIHLNTGRMDPVKAIEIWFVETKKPDLSANLEWGLQNGIDKSLERLEPIREDYLKLKSYSNHLYEVTRSLEQNPEIDLSLAGLRRGDKSPAIVNLKKLLKITGDLPSQNDAEDPELDERLEEALRRFQSRHGLEASGEIDENTLERLRIDPQDRLRTIAANMERMKWFPEFADTRIVINVPEFRMRLYENGKQILEMKAIVGEELNPTPVFSDALEYLVFNPEWIIPSSIAAGEFLPKLKEDKNYLDEDQFLVYESWEKDASLVDPSRIKWSRVDEEDFPYKIVQKPGVQNPLGKVKFMFPNNHSVYLHGTPANHLFSADERGFSHGCIRLEKPFELVDYLLDNIEEWDEDKIREALDGEDPVQAHVEKIPVYIIYETAFFDDEDNLNFRDDIYGIDSAQWDAWDKMKASGIRLPERSI